MHEKSDIPESFESTRHKRLSPDGFDPKKPRLGRRECEPHSDETNYLYEVLTANFPDGRALWDLHHYFSIDDLTIDIQFDISYFKEMHIPKRLSSYKAEKYDDRVPTMAINVLSKSTWKTDIGENVDYCRMLNIPLYVVFPTYHIANKYYKPPFLRAYILQPSGEYRIKEIRGATIEGENKNPNDVIDVSEYVPFRLGLQQREVKHESNKALYRLILLKLDKLETFLTNEEKQKKRAEEAQKRVEKLEDEVKRLKKKLRNR